MKNTKLMLREPSYLDTHVKEDRPKANDSRVLKHIIPHLKRYPRLLLCSILTVIVASFTVLGVGTGLRLFVDYGLTADSPFTLAETLFILLGVVAVMALASYGRLYWVSELSERVIADLRQRIFNHLLKQDIAFFESTSLGEIQSRLTTDTTLLQIVIGTSLPIALRNILIIVGGIGMLIHTSPALTGLIALLIPLILVPILVYGKKVRNYSRLAQEKTAHIAARLDETFGGIRTVLSFTREPYMARLFHSQVEKTFEASLQRVEARARLTALVMLLVFGGISLVLWVGGHDVIKGNMTAGELSAFIFYAAAVAGSSGSLSEIHGDLLRAAGGVERIFDFLSLKPQIKVAKSPSPLPHPLEGRIQFEEVDFAYPSRPNHPILQGTSFEVERGETVALIGPSGVGKTTIFNLIMRFYDPQKGHILLDGISIDAFDLRNLRKAIGLVPQDPLLFTTTLYENIRFGNLKASDKQILAASKAAYAHDFIQKLPHGYHTHVGEKGVALSGGQRQRIAIARAILKNPRILLLDEATSALDTESEQKVQKALDALKKDRTTLVIAHRHSTLEKVDRKIILKSDSINSYNKVTNF